MFEPGLILLIASCRRAYEGSSQDFGEIGDKIDWPRLLLLARRHRVQALGWHGLGPLRAQAPSEIAEQFAADSAAIVEVNLRALAESSRLQTLFEQAGVELLFVKGLTTAALAYPNPFLKMGWDIDVLIEPDQLHAAITLLRTSGYLPAIPASASDDQLQKWHRTSKESVWHHAGSGTHLELHTRLSDHPCLLPGIGLRSFRQSVRISDQLSLNTLGMDELFAYLCVHGASSAWFRLKWITDLAALLRRHEKAEIDRLYELSQSLGAGRSAAQALLLAEQLYGTNLGVDLSHRLRSERPNRWLATLACRQLADHREPTEHFLGTAWIRLSQLPLLAGWKFPLTEGLRQAREIVGTRLGWG